MKKMVVPKFNDENEERDFWSKVDLSKYYSTKDFELVTFPNLKSKQCEAS